MGFGIAEIGTGECAVHAPVIVDSIYRPDPEKFQAVEQHKKE